MASANLPAVVPEIKDGTVLCPCGVPMHLGAGRRVEESEDGGYSWMYWFCSNEHVSEVLPVPTEWVRDCS